MAERMKAMRVGVDSYSYHRLLGEVRPGEEPAAASFADGTLDALRHIRAVGADVAALETAFLPAPADLDVTALGQAAGDLGLVVAWGHPVGLAWGEDPGAVADLLAWIDVAGRLGARAVRMVVAGPGLPPPDGWLPRVAATLDRALAVARARRLELCVENHADLTVDDVERLLASVPGFGVCLDTANALRVGDDPVTAATRLREHVVMVHLKDVLGGEVADPVAGPVSVPYGHGVVDVEGVLRALGPRLAGMPVCVELAQLPPGADERALVAAGVDWLRTFQSGLEERWAS